MAYQQGEKISLEGMSVTFQYPHSTMDSDYEALIKEELGEYLTATPCDGDVFDGSMDGEPIQLVYDDGYTRLVAYSKGNLQQAALRVCQAHAQLLSVSVRRKRKSYGRNR